MKHLRSLIVLVAVARTGVTYAQSTPTSQEMPAADVQRWLGFWDKLVATVAKTQPCDRMASDVSSLVDRNKDAVAIVRTARQQGKKLPEAAQQHMLEGVKKMVPAMQKCGQDAKVRAAFAKLDLNRR
jgi:hypothetical protein